MDKKISLKLLGKFMDFVNARDHAPRIGINANNLLLAVNKHFYVRTGGVAVRLDLKQSMKLYAETKQILDAISKGKATGSVILHERTKGYLLFGLEPSSTGLKPVLDFGYSGVAGIKAIMCILFMTADIKGVGRCEACGRYFLKTTNHKKTHCGSTCRQASRRYKMTEEERLAENKERRDEYEIMKESKQ